MWFTWGQSHTVYLHSGMKKTNANEPSSNKSLQLFQQLKNFNIPHTVMVHMVHFYPVHPHLLHDHMLQCSLCQGPEQTVNVSFVLQRTYLHWRVHNAYICIFYIFCVLTLCALLTHVVILACFFCTKPSTKPIPCGCITSCIITWQWIWF